MSKEDAAGVCSKKKDATGNNPRKDDPTVEKFWSSFDTIYYFGFLGFVAVSLAVDNMPRAVRWFHYQMANWPSTSWKNVFNRSSHTRYKESWSRFKRGLKEDTEDMQREQNQQRYQRNNQQHYRRKDQQRYKQHYQRDNQQHYQRNDQQHYKQHYQRNDRQYYQRNDQQYYRQHYQRDDQKYYQRNDSYWNRDTSSSENYTLSHHYSILGLDRWRTKPYMDEEIKAAFRMKAKEFHPDQNQRNKKFAEAKFKEIMAAYEALKSERE